MQFICVGDGLQLRVGVIHLKKSQLLLAAVDAEVVEAEKEET